MSEIADFISRVGFPAFVAVYVLVRLEPTINKLNNTIRALTVLVARDQGTSLEEIEGRYGLHGKK